ncbi:hypothetical protein [Devosia sp. 2618]|uniref:hypothetical protein n=1 Tax=Devosia sp. 2618 TaxID=3156454 RepID=UPI003393BAFB
MPLSPSTRQRLGIFATACMISVALPSGPAWAQKIKDKGTSQVEQTAPAAAPETSINVEIPEIDAIDSNVDDDTLRAIFSGNVVDNADALAGLTATSITIPEITVEASSTVNGKTSGALITLSDIVLDSVDNGLATSISVGEISVNGGDEGTATFGLLEASNFDINAILGIYGLVDAPASTELKTIYTDLSFEGGSLESTEISCNIGAMAAAEVKARPFKYSFAEIMSLAQSLEGADAPPPELIGKIMRMYADMFTAIETSPMTFDGIDCSGVDDSDRAIDFSIAGITMGAMTPGIYPSISMDGFDVTVEDDGVVQIGNFTMKALDFTSAIATVEAAPELIDEAWLEANARSLIPAFGGFSFSDVVVDVPDEQSDGERIKASVGGFDLGLSNYFQGIPTAILVNANNIVVDLPTDSGDEQLQKLIDLGVTKVDAGFKIDLAWNEAEDRIAINEVSLTGADLARFVLNGSLLNATEALFSLDENVTMAAAMQLAINHLKLDIKDEGLTDLIFASIAAEQGTDAATLRPVFAGLAEGTIIGAMAGAAEAQKLGSAINAFVSGKAAHLSIDLTAKDGAGVGFFDFMAAETDPKTLIDKVTIEAVAK